MRAWGEAHSSWRVLNALIWAQNVLHWLSSPQLALFLREPLSSSVLEIAHLQGLPPSILTVSSQGVWERRGKAPGLASPPVPIVVGAPSQLSMSIALTLFQLALAKVGLAHAVVVMVQAVSHQGLAGERKGTARTPALSPHPWNPAHSHCSAPVGFLGGLGRGC